MLRLSLVVCSLVAMIRACVARAGASAGDAGGRMEALGRRRARVRARQGGRSVGEAHRRAIRRQARRCALFPGATLSLRDPAREFIALRDGAADLAVGSTLFWSAQVVELNVIALPWLAPEDERARGARDGRRGRAALAAVERAGVVPLAFAVLGHRALATSAAAPRSPADFAGTEGARGVDAAPHRSFRRASARRRARWPSPTRRPHFARARSTRRKERSRRSPPRGSTRSA